MDLAFKKVPFYSTQLFPLWGHHEIILELMTAEQTSRNSSDFSELVLNELFKVKKKDKHSNLIIIGVSQLELAAKYIFYKVLPALTYYICHFELQFEYNDFCSNLLFNLIK